MKGRAFHRSVFRSTLDETSRMAHLLLPTHSPLESWGDYRPRKERPGTHCSRSWAPFSTPGISATSSSPPGKKLHGKEKFPWENFYHLLRENMGEAASWVEALKRGGAWESSKTAPAPGLCGSIGLFFSLPPVGPTKSEKNFHLFLTLRCSFSTAGASNRPWMQELPDPITQTTWGSWVEIHPETATQMGIQKGDLVRLRSPHGSLEAPAFPLSRGAPRIPLPFPWDRDTRNSDALPPAAESTPTTS